MLSNDSKRPARKFLPKWLVKLEHLLRNRVQLLYISFLTLIVIFLQLQVFAQSNALSRIFSSDANHRGVHFPDVIIFRRSMKTGSSSMAAAMMHALEPWKYHPLPPTDTRMQYRLIRWESIRNPPRRFFLLHHNSFTRTDLPMKDVLIVDTIRDGFSQITSYCIVTGEAKTCGKDMIECIKGKGLRKMIAYRWGETGKETYENYIDIPLSSAHPGLSSTALGSVFPGITLNVQKYNYQHSACNKTKELEEVYNKFGKYLDKQVEMLAGRLLAIAGYDLHPKHTRNTSVWKFLDEAERHERKRYKLHVEIESTDFSQEMDQVRKDGNGMWKIGDGKVEWEKNFR